MTTTHAAERVRSFGTSIFAEVSALAIQYEAVNLGQGFPDFAGPEWLKVAAIEAINADLNQYAPYLGLPRLREAIAATWQANGWCVVDPAHEVTITSGATEALFAATQALINPGDEVIIFEPFYDAYVPDVVMAGGVPRYVRMHPPRPAGPQTWHFDPAELAAAFSPRTRLLFLNTPHNPTGKVFTPSELTQIAALCIEHDVLVIADEVYDQIVFDGFQHTPIATLPGMWERTVTINSTGKTFSLTGWKIGYVVAAPALSAAIRSAHQWITFATATPLQAAAAVGLEHAATRGYYEQLRVEYVERRDLLRHVLYEVGLPPLPVEGSYFMLADISQGKFETDRDFCYWLTSEVGVAAVPLSPFYANHDDLPLLVRFCFAKKLETLRAAAGRLEMMRH